MENELNDLHLVEPIEEHHEDFNAFTREELLKYLESFNLKDHYAKAGAALAQIRQSFDHHIDIAREEALQRFIADGGSEDDFEYKKDELSQKFEKIYGRLKSELNEHFNNLEKNKLRNLEIKNELLERLRKLIASRFFFRSSSLSSKKILLLL